MSEAAALPAYDARLAETLVLDELFDLSLYRALRAHTSADVRATLDELIPIEARHFAFWQDFFGLRRERLDAGRRAKLAVLVAVARVLGPIGVELILEAIEVYGIRKYLSVWDAYKSDPLGAAMKEILEDEFRHEDEVVARLTDRKIDPERVRDVFLGLNDGLVEILGAVSGFFGAFQSPLVVLMAALTTAIAGALSMAAGAYVATSSEQEVAATERRRRAFLGERTADGPPRGALQSAVVVGASYLAGATVPVFPLLVGARSVTASVVAGGTIALAVSAILAFLSGMNLRRRVVVNLAVTAAAVGITYASGQFLNRAFGIAP